MSLALYQIIIIFFAILMISQGIKNFFKRENGQTFIKLFVRIIVWGGMATIVAFPYASNFIASLIVIQDNVNAAVLAGFLLVFMMIFKLLSAIERLEQQITTVTRDRAISHIHKESEK